MKVFVYRKDTSEKVETLNHVEAVQTQADKQMILVTEDGEAFSCDTKIYKVVIYQN